MKITSDNIWINQHQGSDRLNTSNLNQWPWPPQSPVRPEVTDCYRAIRDAARPMGVIREEECRIAAQPEKQESDAPVSDKEMLLPGKDLDAVEILL